MPKLKDTLKKLADLDAPAAPQTAAVQIVKQVANQEQPRPAAPVPSQRSAGKPSREYFDPFLESGQTTVGRIPDGPPPGYQYDPDEFAPQQNPIAAAVEQAATVQAPQSAAAAIVQNIQAQPKALEPANDEQRLLALDHWISGASPQEAMDRVRSGAQAVQQVQSGNSLDGRRIVMASRSPNDWILNDDNPGATSQRPRPRSRDEWILNDISPGPTPSQEWVLEPDLPVPAAAARVIQDIQAENSPQDRASDAALGGESSAADRAADVVREVVSGGGSGGGTPPPRRPTAFDPDRPDKPDPPRYTGAHAGDSRASENYNAGVGGGGGAPPPRSPGSFDPNREDRPDPPRKAGEGLDPGLWNHFVKGFSTQAGSGPYADSVIGDAFRGRKFPEVDNSGFADKAAFHAGRTVADVQGYGTRKGFWNMNPEDAVGTAFREVATSQGLSPQQAQLARYAAATTLGLTSGNYNPLNIAEGGRTEGFSAVNPDEEDPRKSTNAIGEFFFDRGMLGRTGRVLPWEQFHEERPEVPYQTYADYQDYLRAPSFLGLVKGTMNGIDGPEARIVGSRVQPEAVLAALAAGAAVIGGFKYTNRKV